MGPEVPAENGLAAGRGEFLPAGGIVKQRAKRGHKILETRELVVRVRRKKRDKVAGQAGVGVIERDQGHAGSRTGKDERIDNRGGIGVNDDGNAGEHVSRRAREGRDGGAGLKLGEIPVATDELERDSRLGKFTRQRDESDSAQERVAERPEKRLGDVRFEF